MRIGIINRVPLVRAPLNQWTSKDAEVTLITRYPLADADKTNLKQVIVFEDYDNDLKLNQLVSRLHAEQPFDRLITLSEFDVLRVSKLRSLLQIPGQDYFSGTLFRDKLTMKQFAINQGLLVPTFTQVTTVEEIQKFVSEFGLPVILKPANQAGSKDVHVLNELGEITSAIIMKLLATYGEMDLEQFIQGEMYSVDGIVDQGQLQFVSVSKYLNNLGDSTTLNHAASTFAAFTISEASSEFKKLKAAAMQLLTPPYLDYGTVHLEFIINRQGRPFFVEMGSRTGGLMITNIIERKYGLVMNEAAYKLEAGFEYQIEPRLPVTESGFLTILPQVGRLVKFDVTALQPLVRALQTDLEIGKTYGGMVESIDCIAIMQFDAPNDMAMQNKLNQLNEVIAQTLVWDKAVN